MAEGLFKLEWKEKVYTVCTAANHSALVSLAHCFFPQYSIVECQFAFWQTSGMLQCSFEREHTTLYMT